MGEGVNIYIIQYVAITGSFLFIASVLFLISRRKLREEFSLLWLFFGFIFLGLSIWRKSLDIIASFENAVSSADEPTRDLLEKIRQNDYLNRFQTET